MLNLCEMADDKSWMQQCAGNTYICSTNPNILDLHALNNALGSDMLWWASTLPEDRLKVMANNCLILALYQVEPEPSGQQAQGCLPLKHCLNTLDS